ncbi:MAG: adenosylmethionine--8-amino-7-oxononanoate transaminase [Bdellovibrionales bacterium]|nr:adenosylmethionine--8-amino-7-oxononanoate transaminase [Bdellovibrionales bacterium]
MTSSNETERLKQIDLNSLWHPFTQHNVWESVEDSPVIEAGEGFELIDTEGNRYLDGISALWCNVHGHGVPRLLDAIARQSQKLAHSTLLGSTHRPAIELAEELLRWVPANLKRVFYSDSGSAAVEAGLRMAFEWWSKAKGQSGRTKFISLQSSYHGDTLGSVGVGYHPAFHQVLNSIVVQGIQFAPPHLFRIQDNLSLKEAETASIAHLTEILEREHLSVAAIVIEPIVQGAAGIWVQSGDFLKRVENLARQYGVLLICDEVAVGFGKTGKMFAVEHADVQPDIMILGKGLSGGYLPISAAVATEEIFNGFRGKVSEGKTFYYGQTFSGNPIASAVSIESLKLFRENKVLETFRSREMAYADALKDNVASLRHVYEIRRVGFMTGIELTSIPGELSPYAPDKLIGVKIVKRARDLGLIIRPLGNVMVLMPAVSMDIDSLRRVATLAAEAIESVTNTQ